MDLPRMDGEMDPESKRTRRTLEKTELNQTFMSLPPMLSLHSSTSEEMRNQTSMDLPRMDGEMDPESKRTRRTLEKTELNQTFMSLPPILSLQSSTSEEMSNQTSMDLARMDGEMDPEPKKI